MKHLATAPLIAIALAACASAPPETPADVLAIQDYVEVADLAEVERIRTYTNTGYEKLGNKRYILFKARRQTYLIEFVRDCWELYDDQRITPDIRRDPGYIRSGLDTIRGCRIAHAWEVNDGQVKEIRDIGDAPTGG